MHRARLTALAVLLSSVGAVTATSTPATAADGAPVVWSNDGRGLQVSALDGTALGPAQSLEPAGSSVFGAQSSADGSRVAYTKQTSASSGVTSSVVVRDVSGRLVRSLESALGFCGACASNQQVANAFLSPDGNTAVWTRLTFTGNGDETSWEVRRADVASGAPTTVTGGSDLQPFGFLDATTLIGTRRSGGFSQVVTLPLAGGTPTAASPSTALTEFTVAPAGNALALYGNTDSTGTALVVIPVTRGTSGQAQLGTPVEWGRHTDVEGSPFYLPDGRIVAPATDSLRLYTAPKAFTSGASSHQLVAGGLRDAVSPEAPSAVSVSLNGTSATITATVPGGPDAAGIVVRRSPGGVTRSTAGATVVDTGLAVGTAYTWSVSAIDRSGNESPAVTRSGVATARPAFAVAVPTSSASASASFPVRFSSTNSSSTRYTVDYRLATSSTWTRWVSGAAGATRVFGSAAATGVAATRATPGTSYVFRASATDAYGNSTALVQSAVTSVPYDQTRASYAGSTGPSAAAGRYLGSVTALRAAGASATVRLTGRTLWVVGERCTTCGVVSVYVDGVRVADVDTRASATQLRAVLWSRSVAAGAHTVRLVAKGTAGRPQVRLDGFAARP